MTLSNTVFYDIVVVGATVDFNRQHELVTEKVNNVITNGFLTKKLISPKLFFLDLIA